MPTWGAALRDHSMIPMMGFMVDTSIALLRLILGGILERHPTLQVVHPHVGGVLPYLMGRIEEQTEVKRRGREHITRSPRSYYRQVYLDLVSPDPAALNFAMQTAGPERLLFGSDHPWVGIDTMLAHVRACHWPDDALEKALSGNAKQLFRI
jgi:predicted TIM-barrel fold metal-dependent hydrolase